MEPGAIIDHLARSLAAACEVLFGALLKPRYMVSLSTNGGGKGQGTADVA